MRTKVSSERKSSIGVDKGRFIRRISVAPNAIKTMDNQTAYLVVLIKHKLLRLRKLLTYVSTNITCHLR